MTDPKDKNKDNSEEPKKTKDSEELVDNMDLENSRVMDDPDGIMN